MWECKGTEEVNPVPLCIKVYRGMGFDVFEYDDKTPLASAKDTLDTYLAKFDESKWEISKDLEPRLGDIIVVSYRNKSKGLLFSESGVTAGIIINDKLQVPLMSGGMCKLHGLVTMIEILQAGYCLEYVIRPKHFNKFTAIKSGKQLLALLLKQA